MGGGAIREGNDGLTILPNNQSYWIVVAVEAAAQRIGGHTAEDSQVGEGNLEEEEDGSLEKGNPEEGRLGEGTLEEGTLGEGSLGIGEGIPGEGSPDEGSRELHLCRGNLADADNNLPILVNNETRKFNSDYIIHTYNTYMR